MLLQFPTFVQVTLYPTDENRMATGRNHGLGKPKHYKMMIPVISTLLTDPEVSTSTFKSDIERWTEDDDQNSNNIFPFVGELKALFSNGQGLQFS